jgi:hypothetical protein
MYNLTEIGSKCGTSPAKIKRLIALYFPEILQENYNRISTEKQLNCGVKTTRKKVGLFTHDEVEIIVKKLGKK